MIYFKKSLSWNLLTVMCAHKQDKYIASASQWVLNRGLPPTGSLYGRSLGKIHPLAQTLRGASSQWLPGELCLSR